MSQKIIIEEFDEWKGYTLDEMRYKRALAYTKKEFQKEHLLDRSKAMFCPSSSVPSFGKNIFGKLTGNSNILNYIIIGYKLSRSAISLWKGFKKRF